MAKPFIIKRKKRSGINSITKQKVRYVNLQFCKANEKTKSKVLTDSNGKRIEWFLTPRDSYQRQLNKEADKQLHILVSELELQRDKGQLTYEMILNDIEVQKEIDAKKTSWQEFCETHCNHRITSHLRNYLAFLKRFHPTLLSSGIKDVCSSATTLVLIDTMKGALKGTNDIKMKNGALYSPVTLNHYFNTHYINVSRAFDFGLIDEVPRNLKPSIKELIEAKRKKLKDKKGRYTEEELKLLKEYWLDLKTINPRINKLTYPERELCLRMFFFSVAYTGLRESDLKTLKWRHIQNHDDKNYILTKTMQKTKEKIIIIFSKKANKYLGKRKGDEDFVFPINQYKTDAGLHALWSSIKKKLNIKKGDRKVLSFGMARHTHAYKLIKHVGVDNIHFVQTRLGHGSIKTTLKHYTERPLAYYEAVSKLLENVPEFDVND